MSHSEKHTDFEALCAGYVMDALSAAEREEFEKMLWDATSKQIQLFKEFKEIKDELALASRPISPSAGLEEKIVSGLPAKRNPIRLL